MSEVELSKVEEGRRSTLYVTRDGQLYRHYHDTNVWKGPLKPNIDANGTERYSGNRRVASLVEKGWGEESYRGDKKEKAPKYLQNALSELTKQPSSVKEFASACGVEESTGWNYLCKVVEMWPASNQIAKNLIYPGVLEVCESGICLKGTLKEVMERINTHPTLLGDVEWRCTENRFAHLRLARLCV